MICLANHVPVQVLLRRRSAPPRNDILILRA